VSEPVDDVHQLDPEAFYEHARSFEFWFGAVQGYLEGACYGRRPDLPESMREGPERERLVTALCNYCVGETIALEGAGALIRLAPNRASKVFLATQTVDEGRHLEVLVHRLLELGVADPEAEIERRTSPSLRTFRDRHQALVRGEDWEAALFAQNVILEEMEFAVFHRHAQLADPRTREVLLGIVKDERRHIGFGENSLGRRLAQDPHLRERLARVRAELDPLILRTFEEAMAEIGAAASERDELARSYLQAVARLGFA
jgi:1,2-phenylacetyl-CoA epoxidase catalytic subunit